MQEGVARMTATLEQSDAAQRGAKPIIDGYRGLPAHIGVNPEDRTPCVYVDDVAEIFEIFELMAELEAACAGLAARRMSQEERARLVEDLRHYEARATPIADTEVA